MVRVPSPPLSDPVQLQRFVDWARGNKAVLHVGHEAMCRKAGIDLTGVTISRLIPEPPAEQEEQPAP
jgi:hypothetical protein